MFEGQDEVKHELTGQEAQELVVYEDAIRHKKWASKPNIRKYDYIFNGKLKVSILNNKYFRDSEKVKIESRLGDMLIDLYEQSEVIKKKREADEEAQRKREEEAQSKIEAGATFEEATKLVANIEKKIDAIPTRKIKRLKITDASKIERQFLVPNEQAIKEALLAGIKVSGCELVEEEIIVNR